MTTTLITGPALDVLKTLPPESVHCCITSPPFYQLRQYHIEVDWPEIVFAPLPDLPPMTVPAQHCELGLENDLHTYCAHLVAVFREVRRVLRSDGTLWLNLGDSYAANGRPGNSNLELLGQRFAAGGKKRDTVRKPAKTLGQGLKPKDLMQVPARVALALQADGWWLRSDIVWSKTNPLPESVTDRPSAAWEHVYLLSRSARYFYAADAVRQPYASSTLARSVYGRRPDQKYSNGGPGKQTIVSDANPTYSRSDALWRNLRNVWPISTKAFPGAHFATMPPELVERCIRAGTSERGEVCTVLDPFGGAGTTGLVADRLCRHSILIEAVATSVQMARARIKNEAPLLAQVVLG